MDNSYFPCSSKESHGFHSGNKRFNTFQRRQRDRPHTFRAKQRNNKCGVNSQITSRRLTMIMEDVIGGIIIINPSRCG